MPHQQQQRVFLVRGLIAIAWAIAFAMVSDSLSTGAAILIVAYPLIDAVASAVDARSQTGETRRVLELNALLSTMAAVALAIAATGDAGDVLFVFGAWAALAGAAQLVVAIWRRPTLGNQWPLLLAGTFSVVAGIFFIAMSGSSDPKLRAIAIYAATGGVEFVIQAWLLSRRNHRLSVAG